MAATLNSAWDYIRHGSLKTWLAHLSKLFTGPKYCTVAGTGKRTTRLTIPQLWLAAQLLASATIKILLYITSEGYFVELDNGAGWSVPTAAAGRIVLQDHTATFARLFFVQ